MMKNAETVTSVYCERARMIIPLADGFCRACSGPAREGDGRHQRLTPLLLKQMGYVTTPLAGVAAEGAERHRILCIDNHASRNLAVFLLEQAHYEVVTASSADEGLKLAEGARFDLFLLNHRFLRGAAKRLCDQLRRAAPGTPILFYSTVTYPYRLRRAVRRNHSGHRAQITAVSEVARAAAEIINRRAQPGEASYLDVEGDGLSTTTKVLAGVVIGAAVLLGSHRLRVAYDKLKGLLAGSDGRLKHPTGA